MEDPREISPSFRALKEQKASIERIKLIVLDVPRNIVTKAQAKFSSASDLIALINKKMAKVVE